MANAFQEFVRQHGLVMTQKKMHVWTSDRPARNKVVGKCLKAEGDLTVLGLSVVAMGPPEYERRFRLAC